MTQEGSNNLLEWGKLSQEIAAKRIDIEQFRGFLTWTQVPNVSEILKHGLQLPDSRKKTSWHYGGSIFGIGDTSILFATVYSPLRFSFQKLNLPWINAGAVGVLVDGQVDPKGLQSLENEALKPDPSLGDLQYFRFEPIDASMIRGLVWNPTGPPIQDRRKKVTRTIPDPHGEMSEYTAYGTFPDKEMLNMLIRRLNRLVGTKYQENLVPLYDHEGNMLWPRVDKTRSEEHTSELQSQR